MKKERNQTEILIWSGCLTHAIRAIKVSKKKKKEARRTRITSETRILHSKNRNSPACFPFQLLACSEYHKTVIIIVWTVRGNIFFFFWLLSLLFVLFESKLVRARSNHFKVALVYQIRMKLILIYCVYRVISVLENAGRHRTLISCWVCVYVRVGRAATRKKLTEKKS